MPAGRVPILLAGGATAAPAVAPPVVTNLASVLTRQVLQDGELVILILRPSRWYVMLSSLRWTAAVLIAAIGAQIANAHFTHVYVETAAFAVSIRVMWAIINWMARLYVLTDRRIIRLSGVFSLEIFDCPLRKVARTRLIPTIRERLLRLSSIEIIPQDDDRPCGVWQTVAKPTEVHEQIQRSIARAKRGGLCS